MVNNCEDSSCQREQRDLQNEDFCRQLTELQRARRFIPAEDAAARISGCPHEARNSRTYSDAFRRVGK